MADSAPQESSSFTRAFLPGLILGLVVGGLCGAVLPELVSGPGTVEPGAHDGQTTTSGPREQGEYQQGADSASEAAQDAANNATEAAQDAGETARDTLDDATEPATDPAAGEGDDPTSGG
ncbi:MAG: hypothetical protein ACF8Q5_14085 [Phycisphaerales bacterium JB040]